MEKASRRNEGAALGQDIAKVEMLYVRGTWHVHVPHPATRGTRTRPPCRERRRQDAERAPRQRFPARPSLRSLGIVPFHIAFRSTHFPAQSARAAERMN